MAFTASSVQGLNITVHLLIIIIKDDNKLQEVDLSFIEIKSKVHETHLEMLTCYLECMLVNRKEDILASFFPFCSLTYLLFFFFIHLVPPEFINTPDRLTKVIGNSVASVSCRAFGFPPPTIVWSRGLVPLPQGRSSVINGTLNISSFSRQDVGPYQCKATNKLGSVTALTTLHYVNQGKNQL